MNNFERIKTFNEEELAELLYKAASSDCYIILDDEGFVIPTKENFLKWLNKSCIKKPLS